MDLILPRVPFCGPIPDSILHHHLHPIFINEVCKIDNRWHCCGKVSHLVVHFGTNEPPNGIF